VFKKFFGKKNDGFFLQLEDEDASSKPAAKAETKAKVPEPVPTAPATAVTTEATPVAATKTEVAPTATPASATAKVDKKADKKSVKKAETPKVEAATAAPTPVASKPAAPAITNFATDYLIKPSSNSSRRMPGANMRGFLDLARQVDKPKAFKATASERKGKE
jgi:hypothetical protein